MVHAWNPVLSGGWIRRFGQRADVYYAYDELRACPWKSKHGRSAEDALLPRCDAVIVTSNALQERLAEHGPKLVRNGVDYEAFQRPDARLRPPGIDRDRPVIGYVGSIDARVDVPLLARLARENPEWQVVVAGPVRGVDASPLGGIPNLLRLGPVSREQLPALVTTFDVGLVPFVDSDFTRALCPLKIYDYLAAGIGVAATPFAPLEEVRDVVRVAPESAALAEAVRAELVASPARTSARRRVAREAAWPARARAFASILDRALRAPPVVPCPAFSDPAAPSSSVPTPSTP
jgi:glycosyltransferase involved in cell wall biosynthesis